MPFHPLSNNPWLDNALEGISTQDVYVDSSIKGGADLQTAIEGVLPGDGSITVVVLPESAIREGQYSGYLLDQLAGASGSDTVILSVDGDLQATSKAIDPTEAARIANENESSAGSTQAALVETVEEIGALSADSPGGSEVTTAAPALPLIIGGVLLIAAAITAIGLLSRRAQRRRRARTAPSDPLPADIRLRVDRLRQLRIDYAAVSGSAVAAETASGIDTLASHIEQLFIRLDAKGGAEQTGIAEAEYADKLARLVAALERDYLLDLLTRPDLWDDPEERIGEVREALAAMTTQIVDNIKQVNARTALKFQVSLDSLIGRSELRDWERQFKSTDDA